MDYGIWVVLWYRIYHWRIIRTSLSLYENVLMADWVKCWWCSLCCGDISSYRTNGRVSSVNFRLQLKLMKRVNYLCTCIAINLMLIICFGVNPNGKSQSIPSQRRRGDEWLTIRIGEVLCWWIYSFGILYTSYPYCFRAFRTWWDTQYLVRHVYTQKGWANGQLDSS